MLGIVAAMRRKSNEPDEPIFRVRRYKHLTRSGEPQDAIFCIEDEIEAVRLESKRTLKLVLFVENDAIDILYYSKPYYVAPADELAEEVYVVLREALKCNRMTCAGQLSVRGQERLVALRA